MQTFSSQDLAAELARDLVAVAIHVVRESSQDYYQLVDELDLSISQTRTLHCLERRDAEIAVNELAEVIGLSVPATSRNVESLLRRGLLERRPDEHDRRVKRVRLSPTGQALVARMTAARMAGMEELAATMTGPERARLRRALACLIARPAIAACRPDGTPSAHASEPVGTPRAPAPDGAPPAPAAARDGTPAHGPGPDGTPTPATRAEVTAGHASRRGGVPAGAGELGAAAHGPVG